jgi:CheY-like chemotaxis protein
MNGVESIESLRAALQRDFPAIVMTGDTRSKTLETVASHGISVLVKPFLANELIRLINRLTTIQNLPTAAGALASLGNNRERGDFT